MAIEHFIYQHLPYAEGGPHHHPGKASELRAIQSSDEKIREYLLFDARRQRAVAHERGVEIGNQPLGHVEGDQYVPGDWEALQEIRAELEDICP